MYNTDLGVITDLTDGSVICTVEESDFTNDNITGDELFYSNRAVTVLTPEHFNGSIASRWVYLAALPYRTVNVTSQTESNIRNALFSLGTYFISNTFGINGLLVSTYFYLVLGGLSYQFENDIKKYSDTYYLKSWEYGNYNVVNDYAYALVAYNSSGTQLGDVRHSSRLTGNSN